MPPIMESSKFRPALFIGPGYSSGVALAIIGILASTFIVSAFLANALDRFPGDLAVSLWVQSWEMAWLRAVAAPISIEKNGLIILVTMLLIALGLYFKNWRLESFLVLGSTVSGALALEVAKALISRPRPAADLVFVLQEVASNSYPSGNVTLFSLYLMTLAFVVAARSTNRRRTVATWCLCALLLAFIGISRIYLGAHWLSDVVGGYLLALTWTLGFRQIVSAVHTWRSGHAGRDQGVTKTDIL